MAKDPKKGKGSRSGPDPESMSKLISLLDAYRILRFEDFRWIDKTVNEKKLDPLFTKNDWKPVRKVLWKMATVPRDIMYVKTLQKIRSIVLFVGQTIFFGFFVILILSILGIPQMAIFAPYTLYLGIAAISSFLVTIVARPLIDGKISFTINKFYEEHPQRYEKHRAALKSFTQKQIDKFRSWAMSNPEDLEKNEMKLYNVDYSGIRIVKPVRRFRKFYVVKLKLE